MNIQCIPKKTLKQLSVVPILALAIGACAPSVVNNGELTSCPDAWSKQLAQDRFVLVLPTEGNPDGEAVLDRETCLVWELAPGDTKLDWDSAVEQCISKTVGSRMGWHLPTIEQLLSLIDRNATSGGPLLPAGHPFKNVVSGFYWVADNLPSDKSRAKTVEFNTGEVGDSNKTDKHHIWCARGGIPRMDT